MYILKFVLCRGFKKKELKIKDVYLDIIKVDFFF